MKLALNEIEPVYLGEKPALMRVKGSYAERGDSGGPCFRERKGGLELVGVARSTLSPPVVLSSYTSVPKYLKWIRQKVAEAEARGGRPGALTPIMERLAGHMVGGEEEVTPLEVRPPSHGAQVGQARVAGVGQEDGALVAHARVHLPRSGPSSPVRPSGGARRQRRGPGRSPSVRGAYAAIGLVKGKRRKRPPPASRKRSGAPGLLPALPA